MNRLWRSALASAVLTAAPAATAAAEPPRGSITIERIADIKYPTNPAWSPDGTKVAFLWDAAGKQDLFVVTPGSAPVALTDFPVDPDLLVSDIGAFAWVSNDEILFGKDGQLWTVSVAAPNGRAGRRRARRRRRLHAVARSAADRVRAARPDLDRCRSRRGPQRQLTNLPEGLTPACPVFSTDGRWLAFTAARGGLEPEDLPWNGADWCARWRP